MAHLIFKLVTTFQTLLWIIKNTDISFGYGIKDFRSSTRPELLTILTALIVYLSLQISRYARTAKQQLMESKEHPSCKHIDR